MEHLRSNTEEFIERYYNQKRLQSALGYCSPAEFEHKTDRVEAASSGEFWGVVEVAYTKIIYRAFPRPGTGCINIGTFYPYP